MYIINHDENYLAHIRGFKYIKRERKNGHWVYTYPDDLAKDKLIGTVDKENNLKGLFFNKEDKKRTLDMSMSKMPRQKNKESIEDSILKINPHFRRDKDGLYDMNCWSCATSYELRRRGYDVEAVPDPFGGYNNKTGDGVTPRDVEKMFKNASFKQAYKNRNGSPMTLDQYDNLNKELIKQGNGARGYIAGYYPEGGGHIMNYEIVDGQVWWIDTQPGTCYKGYDDALDYDNSALYFSELMYMRTDDKEFAPEKKSKSKKDINDVGDATRESEQYVRDEYENAQETARKEFEKDLEEKQKEFEKELEDQRKKFEEELDKKQKEFEKELEKKKKKKSSIKDRVKNGVQKIKDKLPRKTKSMKSSTIDRGKSISNKVVR